MLYGTALSRELCNTLMYKNYNARIINNKVRTDLQNTVKPTFMLGKINETTKSCKF